MNYLFGFFLFYIQFKWAVNNSFEIWNLKKKTCAKNFIEINFKKKCLKMLNLERIISRITYMHAHMA